MTCDELNAQLSDLLQQMAGTRQDITDALAEEIDDPARASMWKARAAALRTQLAGEQAQRDDLDTRIAVQCAGFPVNILTGVAVTFRTLEAGREDGTLVHVFVKNRSTDTSIPLPENDFLSNKAGWDRHEAAVGAERNPFLAFGEALGFGTSFGPSSTRTFDLTLRTQPVPASEIVLPVLDVHMLADGDDQWSFSWSMTFSFSDGSAFTATSDVDGISGIVLDQAHRNYSGLGREVRPVTATQKPVTDEVLILVELAFATRGLEKPADIVVNLHLVNRLSASHYEDIAVGLDVLPGVRFADGSTHGVTFGVPDLPLTAPALRLSDVVLPLVFIVASAPGDFTWAFDYQVRYVFDSGRSFTSRTNDVILTGHHPKHAGAYRGDPFPAVTPPGRPALTGPGVDHASDGQEKRITLAYLRQRLNEFVTNRQGVFGQLPPLRKVRLHNSGLHGSTVPESYVDLLTIDADPPPPGSLTPPEFSEGVTWRSHPTSLGQLDHDIYFDDINSNNLTITIDGTQPTPIVLEVGFETEGQDIRGVGTFNLADMDFSAFSVQLRLTLTPAQGIDLFGWIDEIENIMTSATHVPPFIQFSGPFLGQPFKRTVLLTESDDVKSDLIDQVIHVVATAGLTDFGGKFQKLARGQIYDMLSTPDPFGGRAIREGVNAAVASFLMGGVMATEFTGGCTLKSLKVTADEIIIRYTGPASTFDPPMPPGWPAAFDLTPGTLANVDHIVVLTMENRSFDHMLGYLSIPRDLDRGGRGRADVDGLTGHEHNTLDGTAWPSFPLQSGDTVFAPDPPHGYEPVSRAVGNGLMDGFVREYAEERGSLVAPRIMGYHTAVNVPVYDAMARDFAIGHRWFAAHPGPTFCNRFYELTGHLNIDPDGFWEFDNSSSIRPAFTPTIFDHLTAAGVSWRYFEQGYCFLRLFEHHTFDQQNINSFDDPVSGFLHLASTGSLPSVSFIDPHYIELPPGANDDGPPADIRAGQDLVRRVVEAVVTSPQWRTTMLIVVYDEHGGFFDHVPPPPAVPVTPESLGSYGLRVPAFVVSPWVAPGSVFGHDATTHTPHDLHFDHTSILKTITRRFLGANPPRMGMRYAMANDLSAVLRSTPRPGPFRPFIPYTLIYSGSHQALEVRGLAATPGAVLQQAPPIPGEAQRFCLEDAGNGQFRIRTHDRALYLTAQPDLRVLLADSLLPGAPDDRTQRWHFESVSVTVTDPNEYVVRCDAHPGQVLQPAGNGTGAHLDVVLGPPLGAGPHSSNRWTIVSPLLPPGSANGQF